MLQKAFESTPLWLRIAAIVVHIAAMVLNSVYGVFGNSSVSNVSAVYRLFVTPPSYTFGIWGLIYLSMAVALIWVAWRDCWPPNAYWTSIAISILNAAWVLVWSNGTKTSIVICLFIILFLFSALYTLWLITHDSVDSSVGYIVVRNIVSFYFGWVLIATLLNLGMVLVFTMGFPQKTFVTIFWILAILAALAITFTIYRQDGSHGLMGAIGFWLAVLWGFWGALQATSYPMTNFI